jgi:DNA transformation protein and related proteins
MDKPILKDSMQLFEKLSPVTSRSMFGGFGLFIEGTMFALVVKDKLHLRADDTTLKQFTSNGYKPYVYSKRGFPVITKYYALPDECWENPQDILAMGKKALENAKVEKNSQSQKKIQRLKDLPNLRLTTERMLKKAGINSVDDLYNKGALNAYKAIQTTNPNASLTIELLWALEGAIEGTHWSVIPQSRRDELLNQLK